MQNNKRNFFYFLLIVFTLYAFPFTPALVVDAQQAQIAVGPPVAYVAIQPGKQMSLPVSFENKGDPGTVKLKVRRFEVSDASGHVDLKETDLGPMKFSLEEDNLDSKLEEAFFVKTNETKKIRLRIEVPGDIVEKDYHYSLLAELQPPPEQEGVTSVRIKVTTVSHIVLTVTQTGRIENKGKILSFTADSPQRFKLFGNTIFDSGYPVELSILLENSGRNFIRPAGKINLRGQLGAHASHEWASPPVLAGSQRKLSLKLPGLYVGGYKAAATFSLGEGAPVVFAQTSFVALPLRFLVILIIVGIGLGAIIFHKRKRKNK